MGQGSSSSASALTKKYKVLDVLAKGEHSIVRKAKMALSEEDEKDKENERPDESTEVATKKVVVRVIPLRSEKKSDDFDRVSKQVADLECQLQQKRYKTLLDKQLMEDSLETLRRKLPNKRSAVSAQEVMHYVALHQAVSPHPNIATLVDVHVDEMKGSRGKGKYLLGKTGVKLSSMVASTTGVWAGPLSEGPSAFLVYERLRGPSVSELLRSRICLEEEQVARILFDILKTLHHLHLHGVILGRVKLSRLMFARKEKDASVDSLENPLKLLNLSGSRLLPPDGAWVPKPSLETVTYRSAPEEYYTYEEAKPPDFSAMERSGERKKKKKKKKDKEKRKAELGAGAQSSGESSDSQTEREREGEKGAREKKERPQSSGSKRGESERKQKTGEKETQGVVSVQVDVYCAGLAAYEMLCGEDPIWSSIMRDAERGDSSSDDSEDGGGEGEWSDKLAGRETAVEEVGEDPEEEEGEDNEEIGKSKKGKKDKKQEKQRKEEKRRIKQAIRTMQAPPLKVDPSFQRTWHHTHRQSGEGQGEGGDPIGTSRVFADLFIGGGGKGKTDMQTPGTSSRGETQAPRGSVSSIEHKVDPKASTSIAASLANKKAKGKRTPEEEAAEAEKEKKKAAEALKEEKKKGQLSDTCRRFVRSLLDPDPLLRLTAAEALYHPFIIQNIPAEAARDLPRLEDPLASRDPHVAAIRQQKRHERERGQRSSIASGGYAHHRRASIGEPHKALSPSRRRSDVVALSQKAQYLKTLLRSHHKNFAPPNAAADADEPLAGAAAAAAADDAEEEGGTAGVRRSKSERGSVREEKASRSAAHISTSPSSPLPGAGESSNGSPGPLQRLRSLTALADSARASASFAPDPDDAFGLAALGDFSSDDDGGEDSDGGVGKTARDQEGGGIAALPPPPTERRKKDRSLTAGSRVGFSLPTEEEGDGLEKGKKKKKKKDKAKEKEKGDQKERTEKKKNKDKSSPDGSSKKALLTESVSLAISGAKEATPLSSAGTQRALDSDEECHIGSPPPKSPAITPNVSPGQKNSKREKPLTGSSVLFTLPPPPPPDLASSIPPPSVASSGGSIFKEEGEDEEEEEEESDKPGGGTERSRTDSEAKQENEPDHEVQADVPNSSQERQEGRGSAVTDQRQEKSSSSERGNEANEQSVPPPPATEPKSLPHKKEDADSGDEGQAAALEEEMEAMIEKGDPGVPPSLFKGYGQTLSEQPDKPNEDLPLPPPPPPSALSALPAAPPRPETEEKKEDKASKDTKTSPPPPPPPGHGEANPLADKVENGKEESEEEEESKSENEPSKPPPPPSDHPDLDALLGEVEGLEVNSPKLSDAPPPPLPGLSFSELPGELKTSQTHSKDRRGESRSRKD